MKVTLCTKGCEVRDECRTNRQNGKQEIEGNRKKADQHRDESERKKQKSVLDTSESER